MKRFRFAPDALLALRRRTLEKHEAELAGLQARREAAFQRAAELERQSERARAAVQEAPRLRGADLRLADASAQALLQASDQARGGAQALDADLARARQVVLQARRNVEVLEALRERSLAEWRRAADKEEETLAAELYLARRSRPD